MHVAWQVTLAGPKLCFTPCDNRTSSYNHRQGCCHMHAAVMVLYPAASTCLKATQAAFSSVVPLNSTVVVSLRMGLTVLYSGPSTFSGDHSPSPMPTWRGAHGNTRDSCVCNYCFLHSTIIAAALVNNELGKIPSMPELIDAICKFHQFSLSDGGGQVLDVKRVGGGSGRNMRERGGRERQ